MTDNETSRSPLWHGTTILAVRTEDKVVILSDGQVSMGQTVMTGAGDVLEPEHNVVAVGSGGNYALAAARALYPYERDAETLGRQAMEIAADICVYTNSNFTIETLDLKA